MLLMSPRMAKGSSQFEGLLDRYFNGVLEDHPVYANFAGLKSVWILDNAYLASPSPVITKQYADTLHPSAIFTDYGGYAVTNPPAVSFSDGVPVVHAIWGDSVSNAMARVQGSAAVYPGRPAFVLVTLATSSMSYGEAKQVMDQLGPSYVAVRPDRFVGLIKGTYGALAGP